MHDINIEQNALIRIIDTNVLYRLLWIDWKQDHVYVYDINREKGMPVLLRIRDIEEQIEIGSMAIEWDTTAVLEEMLSDSEKEFRNKIWGLMEGITQREPEIYDRKCRGNLVAKLSEKSGVTKMTIYKYLGWYWQRGKNKNAFLPAYKKCGKNRKNVGSQKLGRPKKYGENKGKNVDEAMQYAFEKAIKKHYHTRKGNSLQKTYELMLKESYAQISLDGEGHKVIQLMPESELPTIAQFRYWYNKNYDVKEKIAHRKGIEKFELNHRAILGKSDTGIMGPGAKYQIDATIGDIYLVSQIVRRKIIGRPVIYMVLDTFSRMVAGVYVGLEGPSWTGAMMALSNAAMDKVKFCAEYNIHIEEKDWPCHHVPDCILGDRGEMESRSVENLINILGVRIENTPPFRGDMKPIVEQYFRTINTDGISVLPGHVLPDMKERGGHDYRLDAKLDINQFTKIIIECILYHNKEHFMESYERNADMVEGDVLAIPVELWKWGIENYSGQLRSFSEDVVKLCLMPTDTAVVTAKGIRFKGLYYSCDLAIKELWFETARSKGSYKINVSYDPRNMDKIYFHNKDDQTYEICQLIDWQDKFLGKGLDEIMVMQDWEKKKKSEASTKKIASRIGLSSRIDTVVEEAELMAKQTVVSSSKSERVRSIKENRKEEKLENRKKEVFDIGPPNAKVLDGKAVKETMENDLSPMLRMIKEDLEKRMKKE